MKRLALIMSLLLCTLCMAQAKERVIERPPFLAWSSTSIEIDKIVMADTVTTVYIKAFYRPKYWIKIAKGSFLKDNNGMLYPIRDGVGITLDKEFWMPESGEAEFQLLFPPIPTNVTSLDFSEGDDIEGAYKIWGIQLDAKTFNQFELPKNIAVHKANPKMTLPEPVFNYSKAILKGQILDYKEDMPGKGSLYLMDIIRGAFTQEEIEVKEDGTFYKEFDLLTVTPCVLMYPLGKADFWLAPDETTTLIINTRENARRQSHLRRDEKPYGKAVYYDGYLAGLQQELADNNNLSFSFNGSTREEYEQQMKEIAGKTPEEYKSYIFSKLTEFRKQVMQSKCSAAYKEFANITLDLSAAQAMIETESKLKSAHIMVNNLKDEEARKYYTETQLEIPQGYYDVLNEFPYITSPKACYNNQYAEFIETLIGRRMDQNILEGLGDKGTYLAQNLKAYTIGAFIKDFSPLTDAQKAELASLPSAYSNMLVAMNDDLLKKIELNKKKTGFTVNEAGEVSNEDLFPSIISKFRGHTILVDFWATWCGPCRMANKEMAPMKEALKDEDIIYLYITGETSPLGTWQNMIPDIHGEHFRVTDNQWSYLMRNFSIQGVPTYFVIDRDGNIAYKQTGFPGADTMKMQLMKALKK